MIRLALSLSLSIALPAALGTAAHAATFPGDAAYLELDAQGQGAANARTAADLLRHSIAAKEDAAQKALAESRPRPDAEARPEAASAPGKPTAASNAASGKPARPVASTPPAPPASAPGKPTAAPSPGRGLRIGGIAAGGTGVVALGVGIAFGLQARSISNEVSNADRYDKNRDAQGHAAQRNMFVFTGVGAAALATGGVLYYLGDRARKLERSGAALTLAPAVGPSEITVAVAGRF